MGIDRTKITHQAEKLVLQGKIEAAISQYEILVKDNPRDVNTMNKIGDLYSRLGRKREAILQFNKIGEQYSKDGFFLKAIAIYKKITKLDPSSLEPLVRLADLYAQQGLGTEARAQYQMVAEGLLRAGDARRALDAYTSLVRLDPDNPQPHVALADLLAREGRTQDAADQYLKAGQLLDAAGRTQEARDAYRKAAAAQPAAPGVVGRLAAEAEARGDREGAARILREAAAKPGAGAELWILLGETQARAGRHAEAEESYTKALAAAPARVEPRLLLARLHQTRGDAGSAYDAVGGHLEAMARAGKGPETIALLEEILGLDDRHDGALRALVELHTQMKNGESAFRCRTRLLDLLIDRGELVEARGIAEALVKLRPGDASLSERLEQLRTVGARVEQPPALGPAVMTVRASAGAATAAAAWTDATGPSAPADDEEAGAPDDGTGFDGGAWAQDLPEAPRLEPEDEDFIAEHMTEADVFVKYGLADRAVEQLRAVTERYPGYVAARVKLKEIYLEDGNREGAREAMVAAVKGLLAAGDDAGALEALAELRRFDPGFVESAAVAAPPEAGSRAPERAAAEDAEPEVEEADAPAQSDLDEVDFYLAQGLRDEAVVILRRLAEKSGSHPDILARMKRATAIGTAGKGATAPGVPPGAEESAEGEEFEIVLDDDATHEEGAAAPAGPAEAAEGSARAGAPPPRRPESDAPERPRAEAVAGPGGDDLLDLASEIDAALEASGEAEAALVPGVEAEPEGHSLEEIVQAFKKGIEDQVGPEDFDTHYNLGIAYKEMGLLDEAIGEFQFAAKDRRRLADCCSMLGLCFREKGMASLAVKWYRRGLEASVGHDEEMVLAMRYDLAELLAGMGEHREAIEIFTEVYGVNSKFRDVAARIKELERSGASG